MSKSETHGFTPCTDDDLDKLRRDMCPDCGSLAGLQGGPKGGGGQNIFCQVCNSGFNVAFPRWIIWGQRIGKRERGT